MRWGGAYLSGDGTSALQVFSLNGQDILNAHTFDVQNIAPGATVVFNISGATAGLTNMSLSSNLYPEQCVV
jgi:choice-of-anchor A domain-containing protein